MSLFAQNKIIHKIFYTGNLSSIKQILELLPTSELISTSAAAKICWAPAEDQT